MSEIAPLISDLAVILIAAGIITLIFKCLKQPVVLGYIVAGILEFLLIIILTDIGLDNTDCRYILLDTRVQLIVLRKCRIEILGRMSYDDGKNT